MMPGHWEWNNHEVHWGCKSCLIITESGHLCREEVWPWLRIEEEGKGRARFLLSSALLESGCNTPWSLQGLMWTVVLVDFSPQYWCRLVNWSQPPMMFTEHVLWLFYYMGSSHYKLQSLCQRIIHPFWWVLFISFQGRHVNWITLWCHLVNFPGEIISILHPPIWISLQNLFLCLKGWALDGGKKHCKNTTIVGIHQNKKDMEYECQNIWSICVILRVKDVCKQKASNCCTCHEQNANPGVHWKLLYENTKICLRLLQFHSQHISIFSNRYKLTISFTFPKPRW